MTLKDAPAGKGLDARVKALDAWGGVSAIITERDYNFGFNNDGGVEDPLTETGIFTVISSTRNEGPGPAEFMCGSCSSVTNTQAVHAIDIEGTIIGRLTDISSVNDTNGTGGSVSLSSSDINPTCGGGSPCSTGDFSTTGGTARRVTAVDNEDGTSTVTIHLRLSHVDTASDDWVVGDDVEVTYTREYGRS